MASHPKPISELPKGGGSLDAAAPDNRDPAALLTPPLTDSAPSSSELSDAPTIIDSAGPAASRGSESQLVSDLPTSVDVELRSIAPDPSQPRALSPGMLLGHRYEIISLLGEGGMGAVYKTMDRELNRPVALKVIRPALAQNKAIIERFKQELVLSQQVTHRNVIRIYDLGEADGLKFITMEFVQGEDLRRMLLRKKKLSPAEAVDIIQQVCRGLDAAHSVGVIHRDLKPQNIMCEKSGRVLVMDFGLARTLTSDAMTSTGALVGTMDYMSPEQALAQSLDQRSDLYTVGLIFYELLTGKMPFAAESAVASLIKRTQERVLPACEIDREIPRTLSDIVSRTLERDVRLRYQSAAQLLNDLDAWQSKRAGAALSFHPRIGPWARTLPWPWIAAAGTMVLLAALAWTWRGNLLSSPSRPRLDAAPQVSLAILPFRNASGDSSLDWLGSSISDMLSTDIGQSAELRTVSQDRLHQILADLRITPDSSIEPTTLRRLAEFSSADTLVSGKYARFGGQIRIDATLEDLKHERSVPIKIDGVSEKDVPGAVDRLASVIRNNLSFSPDVINELKASSFQPTSQSVAALRDFDEGVQYLRSGKNLDAVRALQSATKEDPQFALAYSRLAEAQSGLGYDSDADQASRTAVELSQSLPIAEKYLIEATRARVIKDNKKAIEAYENLATTMPDNADVESALAALLADTGAYDKARALLARLLNSDPKNTRALWQSGVVENTSGNPQAALEPLNKALSLTVQTDNQELKALILQSLGISYRLMNKPDEAVRNYQEAMVINRGLGLKRNLAGNLVEMAVLENKRGNEDTALSDFDQALVLQNEIGMKKEVGDTLVDRGVIYQVKGEYAKALDDFKESLQIQRDTGDENYQALCLNNIGDIYLDEGDSDNALIYFQQALQLREKLNVPAGVAETLASQGEVYIATGQYDEALNAFMRALDLWRKVGNTRGAADESHDIGIVLEYQGRLGAAINALQEGVKGYRVIDDRSVEMVEMLNALADALAKAGRADESGALLKEAQTLSQGLKNQTVQAELLNTQGDVRWYGGDQKGAAVRYEQAMQSASRGSDPEQVLIAKLHLAEVSLASGRIKSATTDLRTLIEQSDKRNLRYLSLEGSVDLADAFIQAKDYARAQRELPEDLNRSERLGTKDQSARIHYLLGKVLSLTGDNQNAVTHFRQTIALLDDMKRDGGAEKLLQRADLKNIYSTASEFVSARN